MLGIVLYIFKRWPLGYLLLFIFSCQNKIDFENTALLKPNPKVESKKIDDAFKKIRQLKDSIQSGDLILRTGRDFTSEVMRGLSQKNKTYSHCGIASWENDTLFVYHSIGGEFNTEQKIRRDRYSFFCNPYENKGFGVFRYPVSQLGVKNILETTRKFYKQEITFDIHFDLQSDDKMYCSEFVAKVIEMASAGSIKIPTTQIKNFDFIAIDNLFENQICRKISEAQFR